VKIRVTWIEPDGITSFVDIVLSDEDSQTTTGLQIDYAKTAAQARFTQQYRKSPTLDELTRAHHTKRQK